MYQSNDTSFKLTPQYVSGVVAAWAGEAKQAECAPSKINPYQMDGKAQCGHYTQIVKRNSKAVGCAVAQFPEGAMKTVLVVCQYAQTNMRDENTY